jgi:hypothetical protein
VNTPIALEVPFLITVVTPVGIANIGYGLFMIFGAFNILFIPFVYLYCPEASSLSGTEIITDSQLRPRVYLWNQLMPSFFQAWIRSRRARVFARR